MKARKWLALIALVLMFLMTVGCAGGGETSAPADEDGSSSATSESGTSESDASEPEADAPKENVTLTFMVNASSSSEDRILPLVEKYEAEGVTIDYQAVAGSTTDYQTKLTTLFASGTYPDVLFIPTVWSKMHASLGIAQELEGVIDQSIIDDFNDGPMETCKYEGKLIGLPMCADCITLFYNKSMVPEVPESFADSWTFEEFEEVAAKAQQDNGTMHGVVFGGDFSIELPFFWSSGATVLTENQDGVAVNQQGTVDTLNWFRGLTEKGLTSTNILLAVDDAQSMFVSGQSPFYVANCGSTGILLETIEDNFELGATYLPVSTKSGNKIGGWNLEIINETEHLDEAADFLEYMASPEVMNAYCTAGGAMPTRKAAAETIEFGALDPYAPLFIDQIANIPAFATADCVNTQYATYKGLMMQEFQNFISDPNMTAETAAENMQSAIEQALEF